MKDIRPTTRVKVHGPEYVTTSVEIAGYVRNPRSYSTSELSVMEQTRIEGFVILCGSGKVKDQARSLRGVLLRELLDVADIVLDDHEAPNRTFIVATGADGYVSLFSWHEIFNSTLGDGILVALEKDGEPLDENEGELCLVSSGDERPGPRRVRYLSKIEVRRI